MNNLTGRASHSYFGKNLGYFGGEKKKTIITEKGKGKVWKKKWDQKKGNLSTRKPGGLHHWGKCKKKNCRGGGWGPLKLLGGVTEGSR